MYLNFILIILSLGILSPANGAGILILHTYTSYSHRVSIQPLANALASRGHNITIVAPMELNPSHKKHPSMQEIIPESFSRTVMGSVHTHFNMDVRLSGNMPLWCRDFDAFHTWACGELLESLEMQEYLSSSPSIDLVIADYHPDCAVALAYRLDAKLIVYQALPYFAKYMESLGLPEESLTSQSDLVYKPSMGFYERVKNTLTPLVWSFNEIHNVKFMEMMEQQLNMSRAQLPRNLQEMLREKIDLIIMTGNAVNEQPKSLPPMFVSVPGLHINENIQPLSKELESFINPPNTATNDGFIYISFGTLATTSGLPKESFNSFIKAIKSFPRLKFLWKWDESNLPLEKKLIPENLLFSKWFEQQDVLGHERIKGFIFQGGRPSTQEALTHGVPMIAFPILGDQEYNAARMEYIGSGVMLELRDFNEQQLIGAIRTITEDQSFLEKVQQNSLLFSDVPMKPLDTGIYWVEYVLRHKDLSHLKPLARYQNWFQRRLLDVWFSLFALILGVLGVLIMGLVKLCSVLFVSHRGTKLKSS